MLKVPLHHIHAQVGRSIGDIASEQGFVFKNNKGDVGHLVEQLLGVKSSSFKGPDLPQYGLEIKTLPVDRQGRVLENTFVSRITLPFTETNFTLSEFWYKAQKILFVPIIGNKNSESTDRILAQPFIWQACAKEFEVISQDWIDLSSYLRLGAWAKINSKIGDILHIRPKAAHAQDLCSFEALGQQHQILPLGFYLRKSFTQSLIERNYVY